MKIAGVRTALLPGASLCVLQLDTESGQYGTAIGPAHALTEVHRLVKSLLAGRDARGIAGHWQRLQQAAGRRPAARTAAALIDTALWDLRARSNGEPLWKTLGGAQPDANAHVRAPDTAGGAKFTRWCRTMHDEHGFHAVLLTLGRGSAPDATRLRALRKHFSAPGLEAVLMIEFERAPAPATALRRILKLEREFDLALVAGAAHTPAAARQLSDGIAAAVCIGAGLTGVADYLPYIRRHAADIVLLDTTVVGISGALQLADAAFGYELPVMLAAAPGNINVHLAGAMPYFMSIEYAASAAAHLPAGAVRIERGRAIAGDAPGHGLRIATEAGGR
jgi:L-alanine-DL-glutamate epimerase-like enolase superfamily enzyme